MKKIFITGGAGYVGSVLTSRLLQENLKVTVFDLMIYGKDTLPKNENLNIVVGDIRDTLLLERSMKNHDTVIHLACISNDPSFELNPSLGKSINLNAFVPLLDISIKVGIERFIYSSSSSVYGIKAEKDVHEDMSLNPLTDYSQYKVECEEILKKYQSETFTTVTIRPATVCGYSPRQRFDVVVNILTNLAYNKREIKIFGGDQLRPNIHISDMVDAYLTLLNADSKKIAGKIFNAGYENQSVMKIAETVREIIGQDVKLNTIPTDDHRSYHISSKKIKCELGFEATHTISDAIKDLKKAFKNKLFINSLENEKYFNIKRMQSLKIK